MLTDRCGSRLPSDRNVIQESEKKLKYKNLSTEIQRMWNMKFFIIPGITGATGIVTEGLKKYLETIPEKHSTDSLQKNSCTRNIIHYKESATIRNFEACVVGFTIGSRGKVPGKTCEKRINNNNSLIIISNTYIFYFVALRTGVKFRKDKAYFV
jgi:hypothetical protein